MEHITLTSKEAEPWELAPVTQATKAISKAPERKSFWYYFTWPLMQVGFLAIGTIVFLAQRR